MGDIILAVSVLVMMAMPIIISKIDRKKTIFDILNIKYKKY